MEMYCKDLFLENKSSLSNNIPLASVMIFIYKDFGKIIPMLFSRYKSIDFLHKKFSQYFVLSSHYSKGFLILQHPFLTAPGNLATIALPHPTRLLNKPR